MDSSVFLQVKYWGPDTCAVGVAMSIVNTARLHDASKTGLFSE